MDGPEEGRTDRREDQRNFAKRNAPTQEEWHAEDGKEQRGIDRSQRVTISPASMTTGRSPSLFVTLPVW